MSWTFADCLENARIMLDREYDWCTAELSMNYAPVTGWFFSVSGISLWGHIEPFECAFSVGTYEDLVK